MTTSTMAINAAKERQLDWLLDEILGGAIDDARSRRRPNPMPWLAAAIAVLAIGAAYGSALLHREEVAGTAQEPRGEPAWLECHGADGLDRVPANVTALRCFDFEDAACAQLARFARLERLDLSGTDVDARGISRSLSITDAGVRALAPLTGLRWLSLATCQETRGEGLQVLEAMPRLEYLDLTYSGVESPAIERLARLPALRTLVLSHCMNFHGRSLAAVANIPGLRRLDLRACTTLAAKDVLPLAKLKELRHLDLRDLQGRFRGQTASGFTAGGEEPPPPPVQDGVGITDDVVAAFATLPLETLLLGGSESLTDAIGDALASMASLRSLDLANLPKTTAGLLARLPRSLTALSLDHNEQFDGQALQRLPELANLRELGIAGLSAMTDDDLRRLLHGKALHTLRVGGVAPVGKGAGPSPPTPSSITAGAAAIVAAQTQLQELDLAYAKWLTPASLQALAAMPQLTELNLTGTSVTAAGLAALGANRSLRSLRLVWCPTLDVEALRTLAGVPLRELNVYGTKCDTAALRELAATAWPGAAITFANGARQRGPGASKSK